MRKNIIGKRVLLLSRPDEVFDWEIVGSGEIIAETDDYVEVQSYMGKSFWLRKPLYNVHMWQKSGKNKKIQYFND